ncbi:hypothetical protein [Corynebacterium striatum]|uniref:hypothetical protein n=1 Tax=Corynebacterium striatum TaxID=43770 RepID=UPI0027BAA59E|nr:hypothetical protein [Corynebacterium striatum]
METHEELLKAAIEAQQKYEKTIEEAKRERSIAFRRAISGPVTAVELSKALGISNVQVSRIAKGQTR